MNRRVPLPAGKIPQAGARALLELEGKSLALFNVDGELLVIDDSCPHQGASLCGGRLEGRVIQCGAHGLRFDLRTGYLLNSTALKVAQYPVEIIDGRAFIVFPCEESAP